MSCNSFKKTLESPRAIRKCLKSPWNAVEPISPPPLPAYTAPLNNTVSTDLNWPVKEDSYGNDEVRFGTALFTGTEISEVLDKGYSTNESIELTKTKGSLNNPQSPMNVLATVALAISPTFISPYAAPGSSHGLSKKPSSKSIEQISSNSDKYSRFDADGRPFKRARSEALYPSQSQGGVIRPSTSHTLFEDRIEQNFCLNDFKKNKRRGSDVHHTRSLSREVASGKQILEAELLLGFSRGGNIPSPGKSGNEIMSQSGTIIEQTFSAQEVGDLHQVMALPSPIGNPDPKANELLSLCTNEVDRSSTKSENSAHQSLHTGHNDEFVRSIEKTKSVGMPSENVQSQKPKFEFESTVDEREARLNQNINSIRNNRLRARQIPQSRGMFPEKLESTRVMQRFLQSDDDLDISSDSLKHRLDTSSLCSFPSRVQIKNIGRRRGGSAPVDSRHFAVPLVNARAKSAPARGFEAFKKAKIPTPAIRRVAKRTSKRATVAAACSGCKLPSRSMSYEDDKWICCNGCKGWYHYRCAGFKSEREVRSVHKFYCKGCESKYGSSTFVRKSGRAHTAVDYAGLNEGVLRTSDESPEHHYIQSIKDATFKFNSDRFARMRPELITADFFEKCGGITEPIIIPATWNQRNLYSDKETPDDKIKSKGWPLSGDFETEAVADNGQDKLDMVVPHKLTVRQVADLYGPEEKVEVIDVKSQEGEDKRWNMRKWVDYYEEDGEKIIRNVISLEVSASKLGRLIRRPQLVRELDLQDNVWPQEEISNGFYPKVQFYCLMSVADCYTDFHIDFGGSSVYYHILKGKKTFLFIPPTKQNLKKYEDWCLSENQNWTFLPEITKECYRVDLSAGDTMIIPSGWIHAVWTPENSLVIGGNFLTRLHYEMQIRVAEIEKDTKVPRKFRYPHFQKIMWYTAIQYLREDPLPSDIQNNLCQGGIYPRTRPIYEEWDKFGHNSDNGTDKYNSRYYSRPELDGLPELARYLFRTVMISRGAVEGISAEVKKAVTKSIPKDRGEPFDLIRSFAMWVAWKRGNEAIPQWARPGSETSVDAAGKKGKKMSVAALRRLENQADQSQIRKNPKRLSARSTSKVEKRTLSNISTHENSTQMQNSGGHRYLSAEQIQLSADRSAIIPCSTSMSEYNVCDHTDKSVCPKLMRKTLDDRFSNPIPMQKFLAENQQLLGKISGGDQKIPLSQQLSSTSYQSQIENAPSDMSNVMNLLITQRDQDRVNAGRPIDGIYANVVSIQEFSPASKRGRGKACSDCRRSKRRCIHDGNDAASNVDLHTSYLSNRENVRKYENLGKNRFNSSTTEVVQREGTEQGHLSNSSISPGEIAYQSVSAEQSTNSRSKDSTMATEDSICRIGLDVSINSNIKWVSSSSTCTALTRPEDRTVAAEKYQKTNIHKDSVDAPMLIDSASATGRIAIKSETLPPRSKMQENPTSARSNNQNSKCGNDGGLMGSEYKCSNMKEPNIFEQASTKPLAAHMLLFQEIPDPGEKFASVPSAIPLLQQKEKNVSNSKTNVATCPATEPSEDDSLRLVRFLASSEFGLRRRI